MKNSKHHCFVNVFIFFASLFIAGCATDDSDSVSNDTGQAEEQTGAVRGSCVPNYSDPPQRPAIGESSLPMLHVSGREIVNESGEVVNLRGVNFGSWLQVESWINGIGIVHEWQVLDEFTEKATELGISDITDASVGAFALELLGDVVGDRVVYGKIREDSYDRAQTDDETDLLDRLWAWFDELPWVYDEQSLWDYFDARYGAEKAEQLRATLVDNWIGEEDFRLAAELGLNVVRVPFWYQALDDEMLPESDFREQGWQALHQAVEWARQYDLYIILDLHGAPGGQSAAGHAGLPEGNKLWDTPQCLDKTVTLWGAVATYFAGDPHVAAYDLLNEPMGCPDAESYREVHDAIYRAIREADPEHIVMIEDGYLGDARIVSPAEMGWENAMYSVHIYNGGTTAEEYLNGFVGELQDVAEYYERYDCPLFVGEFSAMDNQPWAIEGMGAVFAAMNRAGIHWAPWTWKYRNPGAIWGLYTPVEPGDIDIANLDFEQTLAAFENFATANYRPIADFERQYANNATSPVIVLDFNRLEE
jgi:aryl-phospho-beta-D-glucosidase BglC (GH1 family)